VATSITQRKGNVPQIKSWGTWVWHEVTPSGTAADIVEMFDVPENCRVVNLATRVGTIDSGTSVDALIEADTLSAKTSLTGNIAMETAADVDPLLAASVGVLLVPLANEKFVTIQCRTAAATAGGGDGVLWVGIEFVRTDYDRS